MYKQVLNSISNIEVFPIISLVVFVGFFALLILKVSLSKKEWLNQMSAMPLEDEEVIQERNHSSNIN